MASVAALREQTATSAGLRTAVRDVVASVAVLWGVFFGTVIREGWSRPAATGNSDHRPGSGPPQAWLDYIDGRDPVWLGTSSSTEPAPEFDAVREERLSRPSTVSTPRPPRPQVAKNAAVRKALGAVPHRLRGVRKIIAGGPETVQPTLDHRPTPHDDSPSTSRDLSEPFDSGLPPVGPTSPQGGPTSESVRRISRPQARLAAPTTGATPTSPLRDLRGDHRGDQELPPGDLRRSPLSHHLRTPSDPQIPRRHHLVPVPHGETPLTATPVATGPLTADTTRAVGMPPSTGPLRPVAGSVQCTVPREVTPEARHPLEQPRFPRDPRPSVAVSADRWPSLTATQAPEPVIGIAAHIWAADVTHPDELIRQQRRR